MRSATVRRPPHDSRVATTVQIPERASDPQWLTVARRRAAAWVNAHGVPSTTLEDWRYTAIDAALAIPLVVPPEHVEESHPIAVSRNDLPVPNLGGVRIVVVNGRLVPELSGLEHSLVAGIRVESLVDSRHGRLEQWWTARDGGYRHALRALNDALALDAVRIDLSAGAIVEEPIEVVFVSTPVTLARWSHPRLIVVAGAGARATIVETYVNVSDSPTATNALTQIDLDVGAQITHYVLQNEHTDSFHFSALEGRLGGDSQLSSRLLATGARIGRHEVDIVLAGEGSKVNLDGLFLTGSGQLHDNPLLVEHAAANCTSRQLYKGVVSGDGHGVFNGHIVVRPGADGTDAAQVNKNLLLSEYAEVDTRPRLEINACDVACTHGAAVGQLDPDSLFYLRSRGVSEREARMILVSGFAGEVLDRFEPESLRRRAEQLMVAAGVATFDDRDVDPELSSTVAVDSHDRSASGSRA